jgi:hypothetical protein
MIFNRLMLAALFLLAANLQAMAEIRIGNNHGGLIQPYEQWAGAVAATGENVVISGPCDSACTLILGAVPRNRICVRPGGSLRFHAAFLGEKNEITQQIKFEGPSAAGTRELWRNYPAYVRPWIKSHGGLTRKLIVLEGRELERMFHRCPT